MVEISGQHNRNRTRRRASRKRDAQGRRPQEDSQRTSPSVSSPLPSLKKRKLDYDRDSLSTSEAVTDTCLFYGDSDSDSNNSTVDRTAALSQGLLFSSINTHLSAIATDQQRLIIDTIQQRADGTEFSNARLQNRLDEAYQTLAWWGSVGCEFCFVMHGKQQPGHTLKECDRWHGCDKAKSILRWLDSLDIPRFSRGPGSCCMCTYTWFPCKDICLSEAICELGSKQEKAALRKELDSKPGPDGHCERKPVMKRVIAALCAYDDQFLGKLLADWIPRLLFIFETLTVAFYVRQNYRLGLPPLAGLPRSPPGERSHGQEATEVGVCGPSLSAHQLDGNTAIIIKRWLATIEWWRWKCSYCLASGRRGQSVLHELRECTHGGAEVIETRFGKAIYVEKSAPNTACHRCYLPKHLCTKWTRPSEGGTWVERNPAEWACQFGRHLLRDTITGLYAHGATRFALHIQDVARLSHYKNRDAERSTTAVDDETAAEFLLEGFTFKGIEGIEMMRQLALWSRAVWYQKTVDELLPLDEEGGTTRPPKSPFSRLLRRLGSRSRHNTEPARLRDCHQTSLDVRSARARHAVQVQLDGSLLHRHHTRVLNENHCQSSSRSTKPIVTWSKQELSLWGERRNWEYPDPARWRDDWKDDRSDDLISEEQVQKQLERWSVRCPLCLLYRDPACDQHPLAFCPRVEARQARSIRARLGEELVELQAKGIEGYGPVPWCGDCCLPRSCCPAWACQDATDPASDWEPRPRVWGGGDDYACRSWLVKTWSRRDGSRCQFREVVVNAVSAMCAFSIISRDGPSGDCDNNNNTSRDTLWDQIEDWRGCSRIRFNPDWGIDGWLLSPMPWGRQDVMVMLRIFCQLDIVVEDLWIEKEVDKRRAKLRIPSREGYILIRQHQKQQPQRPDGKTAAVPERSASDEHLASTLRQALDAAEDEEERTSGFWGDSAFYSALGARVRAWRRGGISCQVCMMYNWDEACYLHDMETCTLHKESKAAATLLRKWSGIRPGDGGEESETGQCPHCRFPAQVCRFTRIDDGEYDDDDHTCQLTDEDTGSAGGNGVEIVCRTVAALLTVANGVLGKLVIQEEMGKKRWNGKYDQLSRQWMAEQVRIGNSTVPRIVRIFQRLLDGFQRLSQVGWGKEE
ncbi:hypothetical protein EDB81DRAFT_922310 [Dactylonectria macrodidyma]|uniref:Uncharacterized protein n=1 Tax=Dactylonectria macrodidyma TaxID=307937 RepID=A0A9P9D5H7_9HYPO|nr:hypothetical protein EDB81DRAFT_922310 [Dactylonectria macrodidyma]